MGKIILNVKSYNMLKLASGNPSVYAETLLYIISQKFATSSSTPRAKYELVGFLPNKHEAIFSGNELMLRAVQLYCII